MDHLKELIPRHATSTVTQALNEVPVVVLQGARQVGKSTLARQIGDSIDAVHLTLDDSDTLDFAQTDPSGFVAQAGERTLIIDEAQRAPQIILPIKASVDRDRRPGRFLLTGSSNLLRVRGVGDSLAGRATTVALYPLTQGEIELRKTPETFISSIVHTPDSLGGQANANLTQRITTGGYPEVVKRNNPSTASRWFTDYVERLSSHDANEANQGLFAARFRRLLTAIAAQGQSELNQARLARDSGIPERSMEEYIDLLSRMYLIERLPAWGMGVLSRAIRRPKVALTDSGLAAHLAKATADSLTIVGGREYFGVLLEQFVVQELIRQQTWSPEPYELYHYREDNTREVDILAELNDGSLIGIEVKATTNPTSDHLKQLMSFKDRMGERLTRGILLHTGTVVQHRYGWLDLLPIDALWAETP